MSRYEAIRQGLLEAIAYERGELTADTHAAQTAADEACASAAEGADETNI